jgi:hypothetical protein
VAYLALGNKSPLIVIHHDDEAREGYTRKSLRGGDCLCCAWPVPPARLLAGHRNEFRDPAGHIFGDDETNDDADGIFTVPCVRSWVQAGDT